MPHLHDQIDFVVVAYIVFENKVLFISHRKLGLWLPIGGHIELNEDPIQALFREIQEECGLPTTLVGPSPLPVQDERAILLHSPAFLDIHRISETHRHVGMIYILRAAHGNVVLAEQEHGAIRWFSEEELDDPSYELLPAVKAYAKEALRRAA